jgi:hypothetical protein
MRDAAFRKRAGKEVAGSSSGAKNHRRQHDWFALGDARQVFGCGLVPVSATGELAASHRTYEKGVEDQRTDGGQSSAGC